MNPKQRRHFWNVNGPRTSSHHLRVNSSFIHAFKELATEHCCLYLSCNDLDSLFTAPNTINVFSLNPSNLGVTQTETDFFMSSGFHWEIFRTGSFNSSFKNHIVTDSSQIHCNNIVQNYIDVTINVHPLQRIIADLLDMKDLSVQLLFFDITRSHDNQ